MKRLIFWILAAALLAGCAPKGHTDPIAEMPDPVMIDLTPYGSILLEEAQSEKALQNALRPVPEVAVEIHPVFEGTRSLAVMLDNHYLARPQSGLAAAKVIYEILAEGPITRYMALIDPNENTLIGPVRSARPYFLELAMGTDSLYVHAGGSVAALDMIEDENIDNLNGLRAGSGVFWRENHREMPHNLYTSTAALAKDVRRLRYSTEAAEGTGPLQYSRWIEPENGEMALALAVRYKAVSGSDPVGYVVEYRYDPAARAYMRRVNGMDQEDEQTGEILDAGNILVIRASHRVIDSDGRREVDLIGSGEGLYVTLGRQIAVTWRKESADAPMQWIMQDGTPLVLNPGRTFVQVIAAWDQVTLMEEDRDE